MRNEINNVPVCNEATPTHGIGEMLRSLNEITEENLNLAKTIYDSLYGNGPSEDAIQRGITCATDCIDNTLSTAGILNSILSRICARL